MYIEIEAKLKVDSLASVERRLGELGAEFVAEQFQSDTHLDDADSSLLATDRCLRLRRQVVGESEQHFLTYKGGREQSAFKRRREIETRIDDAASMRRLLLELGYQEVLVVEKKRRLWRLDHCEVALDEVPVLGHFVEIEGPNEGEIAQVQEGLGLSNVPHIAASYAQLVKEQCCPRDV